jgi:LemA protein
MTLTYILIGIIALIILWLIGVYNGFIKLVIKTKEAWSDIDVQLKRRYDLIPNLVNIVKGYATHEKTVFENVTKARALAMGAQTPETKGQAEAGLAGALKSVFALAEAYPDLKANQNFLDLQQKLTETEDTIQAARRFYNGNVRELNIKIALFPSNIVATIFSFTKMEFFQLDSDVEKNPVAVKF